MTLAFIKGIKISNILIVSSIALYCLYISYSGWQAGQAIKTFESVLNPSILATASLVFLLSAVSSYFASSSLKKEKLSSTKTFLLLTQIIGFIFLGVVARELGYLHGIDTPFTYSSGLFGHLYYVVIYSFLAQLFLALSLMFLSYFQLEFSKDITVTQRLTLFACRFWNAILVSWICVFFLLYLF